ncbi:lysine N(6)-hydroxylase/L-ornithine N(5)-oxygenase family protein [Kribbella sp. NBC_01505]|uniref:SidA/IucD/PvdA family monooxygenase n=1 Tax=Kribbella sp. NBC_01505 TaxID=2903580 RepID=UPI00386D1FC9
MRHFDGIFAGLPVTGPAAVGIGAQEIFDTVGVGFGPANIALAVAHAECSSPRSLAFVEANDGPAWQAGMIIDGSDIQHNPLRDFHHAQESLQPVRIPELSEE